jgi:hypothetical protein
MVRLGGRIVHIVSLFSKLQPHRTMSESELYREMHINYYIIPDFRCTHHNSNNNNVDVIKY